MTETTARTYGTVKETHYGVFICKRKKNTTLCAYHAVPEKMLMMVAMDQIHHLVSTMCEEEKLVKDMMRGSNLDSARSIKMKENSILFRIEDLEKQAEAIRVEQIKLYESYADGVLRRDAYIEKKKALSEKLAALQDSIRTEKEEQECADELDEEIRALTKQASEKTYIGGLTKECVDAFVSMVYLYDDQTMKIEFNCEDVIRRALEKYGA